MIGTPKLAALFAIPVCIAVLLLFVILGHWQASIAVAVGASLLIVCWRAMRGPRVGAICRSGEISRATGKGACSNHGGVRCWLYQHGPQASPLWILAVELIAAAGVAITVSLVAF